MRGEVKKGVEEMGKGKGGMVEGRSEHCSPRVGSVATLVIERCGIGHAYRETHVGEHHT